MNELTKKWHKRTLDKPVTKRIEYQFVTAVHILFPPGKLIIHSQQNTFFEVITSVYFKADHIVCWLQMQCQFKILWHSEFWPELLQSFFHITRHSLNSRPAQNCVVTDKRSYITVNNSIINSQVDQFNEKYDAHLKEIWCYIHDIREVLDNCNLWWVFHLIDSIKQAVMQHMCIRIH